MSVRCWSVVDVEEEEEEDNNNNAIQKFKWFILDSCGGRFLAPVLLPGCLLLFLSGIFALSRMSIAFCESSMLLWL